MMDAWRFVVGWVSAHPILVSALGSLLTAALLGMSRKVRQWASKAPAWLNAMFWLVKNARRVRTAIEEEDGAFTKLRLAQDEANRLTLDVLNMRHWVERFGEMTITPEQAQEIARRTLREYKPHELAQEFGVSATTIRRIARGKKYGGGRLPT